MRIAESAIVTALFLTGIVIANHLGIIFTPPLPRECGMTAAAPAAALGPFEFSRNSALTLEN
jgi:hypothetical protein